MNPQTGQLGRGADDSSNSGAGFLLDIATTVAQGDSSLLEELFWQPAIKSSLLSGPMA